MKPLEKEAKVREILGKRYHITFQKKRLMAGKRLREFDLVSQDGKIVGEVKSDKHTEKAYRNTRFPRAMLACRYLELVEADTRLIVFTDQKFYEHFEKDSIGMLLKDIEILHVPL